MEVKDFLDDKNVEKSIYSLRQFLYVFNLTRQEFLDLDYKIKERLQNRIEHNIMSSIKIKNPKDYISILDDQFSKINFISDNRIILEFVSKNEVE